MRKLSILFVILFIIANLNTAQAQMKAWKWDTYKMGFNLPTNMNVTKSSSSIFQASNNILSVKIEPWNDATKSSEQIARIAYDKTNATNKYMISKDNINLTGFKGYEIVGDGTQAGKKLMFLSMGMIDPSSATNFIVTILWWDNASRDANLQTAKSIARSFFKRN